jgi:replicative DNA helicase
MELIAGVIHSKAIMEVIHSNFNSEALTSDRLKWIYDQAVHLYEYDNELLDTRTYKHMLSMKESKKKLYLASWKRIQRKKKSTTMASTLACAEKLKKMYSLRTIELGMKNSLKFLEQAQEGNLNAVEEARKVVADMNEKVAAEDGRKITIADPMTDYKSYKKVFVNIQKDPRSIMGVPTGIEPIDNVMMGLRRSEFGVVFGPTGGGKSITTMNFAAHAWRYVGDTVVVTIEMSEEQYRSRFYSYLSGIKYEQFRKYKMTKSEWKLMDKMIKRADKVPHQLKIVDMPEGCSVQSVRNELQKLMRTMDIQLVVIDYMNIMCGPSGGIDFSWQNQLELAVQIKLELARPLNLPIWTACQVDKSGGAAFSSHIKDQLDVGGLLVHDENSAESNIINWRWVKSRDFKGSEISLTTEMDYMRMTPRPDDLNRQYKQIKTKKKNKVKV